MGAPALLVTALVYGVVFAAAGHHLWVVRGLRIPGGLLIAVAVSMVPLLVYSLQNMLGWWGGFDNPGSYRDFYAWIKGGWLMMEVATILAAVLAIRRYPFGFIAMLVAVALWFMSMDIAPWVLGVEELSSLGRYRVWMLFGLVVIFIAWWVDLRQERADYAYWLHLAGIASFWAGLSFQNSDSELSKLVYCLMNVGLIGFSVFLSRRVYAVFGTMGVVGYLGHLAAKVFRDSMLFPFALTLLGLGVIGLGLWYMRTRERVSAALGEIIPASWMRLRPPHARRDVEAV
jgi:hypothetical protein